MHMRSSQEVTQLLQAWRHGDEGALNQIIPIVYDELHRLAHYYMVQEWANKTLQTTALVHEAYLRLMNAGQVGYECRAHFLAVCAGLMRRILVEFARARSSKKRGGNVRKLPLDEGAVISPRPDRNLIELDEALSRLAVVDQRKAKVVELRFFGGMTEDETAEALGISSDTVLRDWKSAKLWLWLEMRRGGTR
jgi:RNA polymerase sigma-70 factor, ECF subfamily